VQSVVNSLGGYNHWTGLLDSPKLQNTRRSVHNKS